MADSIATDKLFKLVNEKLEEKVGSTRKEIFILGSYLKKNWNQPILLKTLQHCTNYHPRYPYPSTPVLGNKLIWKTNTTKNKLVFHEKRACGG